MNKFPHFKSRLLKIHSRLLNTQKHSHTLAIINLLTHRDAKLLLLLLYKDFTIKPNPPNLNIH